MFSSKTLSLIAAIVIATTTVGVDAAVITIDDTGVFGQKYDQTRPAGARYVLDSAALGGFDASGSDKLVLTFGGEGQTPAFDEVSYGGVDLTRIVYAEPGGQDVAIWYLDNPGSGDLVVDLTRGNGIGLSVMALSNTVDGYAATAVNASGNTTSITTTGTDSLVVAAGERNNNTSLVAVAPLVQVYSGEAGSSSHGSAYQQVAVSGTTITPAFVSAEGVLAVEFLAIPEPASLALLGLGGLMMIRRRRA
jgi:hypothetical protein